MNISEKKKNIFLTGAGSGIGAATARLLAARGHRVWATSRDTGRLAGLAGVHALEMDFARPETVDAAWRRALEESGGLDAVVQNAGRGIFGSIEETPAATSRAQWVDLVEGPLQVLRLAAEYFRPLRRGCIIGVSSLAGEMPMPFFSHYSAGKAALSSLLEGLWMELKPFGVRVVDLRPGDIRTPFNQAVSRPAPGLSPYAAWMDRAWDESCRLIDGAPDPDTVADVIVALLESDRVPAVRRCGPWSQAVLASWTARILPRTAILEGIRRYYGLGGRP